MGSKVPPNTPTRRRPILLPLQLDEVCDVDCVARARAGLGQCLLDADGPRNTVEAFDGVAVVPVRPSRCPFDAWPDNPVLGWTKLFHLEEVLVHLRSEHG